MSFCSTALRNQDHWLSSSPFFTMSSYRRRSSNILNRSERKTSSSRVEGTSFVNDNSSESTNVGHLVQSSNDLDFEVNTSVFQEPSTAPNCLTGFKKLDDQQEELVLDDTAKSAPSKKAQTIKESKEKEPGKCSDDSESDYEERMSENKSTLPQNPDVWYIKKRQYETPVWYDTSKNPLPQVQEDAKKKQKSSRLSGNEDERESISEDNSNNVSTPAEVKTTLSLDDLEEGNSYTEREVYETQLLQLQRQLVETMIKEQESSK